MQQQQQRMVGFMWVVGGFREGCGQRRCRDRDGQNLSDNSIYKIWITICGGKKKNLGPSQELKKALVEGIFSILTVAKKIL